MCCIKIPKSHNQLAQLSQPNPQKKPKIKTLFPMIYDCRLFIPIQTVQLNLMPKVVDNYVFQRKIGQGQYGDVYKGYNKQDNTDIAIKAIKRQNIKGKFLQLLENEIKVLRTCDNKNIIKLYDIKKTANNFYLILQYCNQGDLSQYLKKNKTINEKEALQFFIQILNAFKTLTKNKIMHRDFKLANILMHDGQIKIADFGFSKLLTNEEFTQTMLGSPLNMAPEVLGGNQYNSKADIWSIGVVFYEMLFGFPPYKAANMIDLVNNIKNKPLRFPRDINNINDLTQDVIKRMLIVDPNKRVEWQNLFSHPIVHYLEDKMKKELDETMKQNEDIEFNASKFYLKANMVVDHPHQIEKNEKINNYAYEVVYKKKPQEDMPRKELTKDVATLSTKQTVYQVQAQSQKDIIGDQQTLRQKQIKAFKRNSKFLLHRRNIYVFLAAVAEQAMELGKQVKFSDIVGYLLIRKLLQLLSKLKEAMQKKEFKQLQFWELFQVQKDFKDIRAYVWKEYDVFKVFYETVHNRIKDKVKFLDGQTQAVITNQNSPLNQKVYQKILRDYVKSLLQFIKNLSFKSENEQRRYYVHLHRVVDCLNLEDVFQFEKNGVVFNFHNYYEQPQRLQLQKLRKEVAKRISYI